MAPWLLVATEGSTTRRPATEGRSTTAPWLLAGDPHGGCWRTATGGTRLLFSKVYRDPIAFLKSLQGPDGIFEKFADTDMWAPHVS